MRAFWPALALSFVSFLPKPATAQAIPSDLVQLVRGSRGVHPLASSDGRIPLTIRSAQRIDGALWLGHGNQTIRLHPDQVASFRSAHPKATISYFPPLRLLLDVAGERTRAVAFRSQTDLDGSGVVVGVIDTGVDAAHADLRTADGKTRVAWLLDMSRDAAGYHPELEARYGCTDPSKGRCAIWSAKEIDEALSTGRDMPRDGIGHGTHVASIAAGNGLSMPGQKLSGMAPGASLIVVRATRSGGESVDDTDVLTAAQFVFDQAERMGMPAVVNLSLGADFGPHDGSTTLEQRLAAMVGFDQPGRALVVAAGNSGALYVEGDNTYGIHTEARVAPHSTVLVPTRTVAATRQVTGSVYVWISYRKGDDIRVGLEGPDGGSLIRPLSAGQQAGYENGSIEAAVINQVLGEDSPLTADSPGAVVFFSGTWEPDSDISIALEGRGTADLWVQGTGDAAPSAAGLGQMFVRAVKHGTINVPATHPELLAVGATLNRAEWLDAQGRRVVLARFGPQSPPIADSMGYFSSAGPNALGVPKPEISAPGAFVAAAMSRDATPAISPGGMFAAPPGACPDHSNRCLMVDDHHAIASGTSMASPMVAGAIALLLQLDPSLTQPELVALLQAGARWPSGEVPFGFQLGPGALNVHGARAAYEAFGRPLNRIPDPTTSWVVLSAPYARPGGDWPVVGFVETRSADGTLADGFDAGLLELRTTHAVVMQPLTRVAPGLWRFAVTGAHDAGGDTMQLEVRYAGVTLGEPQTLPIGNDSFLANGQVMAAGGCALSPRGGTDRALWLSLAAATCLWQRRRAVSAAARSGAGVRGLGTLAGDDARV